MSHPSDYQLVEHAAGRLEPPEAGPVAEHLAGCDSCASRARALARVWASLGAWEVPLPGRDFTQAVMMAAQREAPRSHLWEYSRIAAAVVLAVGLGHLAGRAARTAPAAPVPVDEVAAAQAVGLDALADGDDLDIMLQLAQADEGSAR